MALIPTEISAIETAAQSLDKCIERVNDAPSIEINAAIVSNQGTSSLCAMILSREKFNMVTPEMLVWYDGTTQWTYMIGSQELSITEPFEEELLQVNPFAILKNYAQTYTCRRLSGSQLKIELIAKSVSSEVSKAIVSLDANTYLPTRLDVTMRNGTSLCVKVNSSKIGAAVPSSVFKFDKNKYKVSEINDLR